MPIQLPPISRREFLRRTAMVGAGLALTPQLVAAPMRRVDKSAWALLSDTHIADDPTKVSRGVNMAAHLQAVTADVLSLPQLPARALVAGDCALSAGLPGEYAQFAGLISPLRMKGLAVTLALGNHDHRQNFQAGLREAAAQPPVADKQVAWVRTKAANWLVLDSLDKTASTPGLLGVAQLAWLAQTLDADRETPAIVAVHHHPGMERKIAGLTDTEEFLAVLRPRRQVKALIYGHTHTWRVTTDVSGIHFINLPPVAYPFRPEDPAGWVLARVQGGGMSLQLRCVETARPEHLARVDLKWRPA